MSSNPSAHLNAIVPPAGWRPLLGWRRVRTVAIVCTLFVLLFSFGWKASMWHLVARVFGVGLALLLVFGLFEQWPRRLPRWLARWALQVAAVGARVPVAPGRLEITTGWPNSFAAIWASARNCTSVTPPAGKGTIRVIGRLGKAWARALPTGSADSRLALAAAPSRRRRASWASWVPEGMTRDGEDRFGRDGGMVAFEGVAGRRAIEGARHHDASAAPTGRVRPEPGMTAASPLIGMPCGSVGERSRPGECLDAGQQGAALRSGRSGWR